MNLNIPTVNCITVCNMQRANSHDI